MSAENEFFVPATDIVEMEDGVHIFMDLPGVGADNLSIDLEEDEVTIRGESRYTPGLRWRASCWFCLQV